METRGLGMPALCCCCCNLLHIVTCNRLPPNCGNTQLICRPYTIFTRIHPVGLFCTAHVCAAQLLHLCEIGRWEGVSHFHRKGKVFLETTLISAQQRRSLFQLLKLERDSQRGEKTQTNKMDWLDSWPRVDNKTN